MVDVPVVPAARFKGHYSSGHLFQGQHVQITLSIKILGIARIFFPQGKGAHFFQFFQIHDDLSFPVLFVLYSKLFKMYNTYNNYLQMHFFYCRREPWKSVP